MSTILDALRRAEAERPRDRVPGLHSQPLPPLPGARRPLWSALAVAMAALIGGALIGVGWIATRQDPVAVVSARSAPPPATSAPVVSPSEGSVSRSMPESAAAPHASTTVPAAASRPAAVPAAADKALPVSPRVAGPTASNAPAPSPRAGPKAPSAGTSEPVRRDPPGPPPRWADLPETFRREMPELTLGGVVYSSAAGSRMAIVNGQVVREGQTLPSGVRLERVFPLAAVFSYRGQRFELMP